MSLNIDQKEFQQVDIGKMLEQFHLSDEAKNTIEKEGLLPEGLLRRLQAAYPGYSNFNLRYDTIFTEKSIYSGIRGFREIVEKLKEHGIELNHLTEREFFIDVYRFLATKYFLNCIDWNNYEDDPLFHLVFPQPGMIAADEVRKYEEAKTPYRRLIESNVLSLFKREQLQQEYESLNPFKLRKILDEKLSQFYRIMDTRGKKAV